MPFFHRNERSKKGQNIMELVGTFPNVYGLCWSCMPALEATNIKSVHQEIGEMPESIQQEYVKASNIVKWINGEFPETFTFRLIDSSSMLGFWKTVRHRIKKTPCLIYKGKKLVEGIKEKDKIMAAVKKVYKKPCRN